MTQPTLISVDDLAAEFNTDLEQGLSGEEAEARLQRDGLNELEEKAAEPIWRKFLKQFQDPLVYLLVVAMAISFAAWIIEGAQGAPIDVIVIAIIVITNAVIGFVEENKAEQAVAALSKMTASNSIVIRDGELKTVPSTNLVVGDLLTLSEGDAVDADARLISASGLKVQEAALTGESEAAVKDPADAEQLKQIGDRLNMVHKGTAVVEGVGQAIVVGTGMNTEMGAIADMLQETESEPSPLNKEIAKVSKMLGILVIAIALVTMIVLGFVSGANTLDEFVEILLLGVSLAVAAVPEGLPAILSLVLAIGVQVLARHNAIMKGLSSVETLGSASVIASDKTGTLTRNEMTLRRIFTASGDVELTGSGYEPSGEFSGTPNPEVVKEASIVVAGGAIANNAGLSFEDDAWQIQGDPTEGAFLVAMAKIDGVSGHVKDFDRASEVPFTSDRKMMSVSGHDNNLGESRLYAKGAPDVLLSMCSHRVIRDKVVALDDSARNQILAQVEEYSADGYRTLGVAFKRIDDQQINEDDEQDMVFAGFVGIIDPPRQEAKDAISQAHGAGIRTLMITGDHPMTASSIAKDLGISAGEKAITGDEIDSLSEAELKQSVRRTNVYARVSPAHKLQIIDALREDKNIVAMTGDGVNDAPALKKADIGVAMGITGTEVTKRSADMILADDNYSTIVQAVRHGRIVFSNIKKFLRFLLSSNMGEVITIFFGVILAGVIGLTAQDGVLALPLLATQILWINLVTDSAPALAMGVDPEVGNVMNSKPRNLSKPIIDSHMWSRIIFIGVIMGTVTLLTIDIFLPGGLVNGSDSLEVARTAGFTTLVFAQLFNAFNSRSDDRSAFVGFFSNKWLWASIALVAVLQILVVHVPFLQSAFSTQALDLKHWLVSIAMASVVLWSEEIAKLIRRAVAKEN